MKAPKKEQTIAVGAKMALAALTICSPGPPVIIAVTPLLACVTVVSSFAFVVAATASVSAGVLAVLPMKELPMKELKEHCC